MSIASNQIVQLRILQRQYLQLVDPLQLRWPDAKVLKSPETQSWIFLHMFDKRSVKSPPPERYQLRVLKLLIAKLERSVVDPEEDVRFPISSSRSFDMFVACASSHTRRYSSPRYYISSCSRMHRFYFTVSC
jgi:hypothetical protein